MSNRQERSPKMSASHSSSSQSAPNISDVIYNAPSSSTAPQNENDSFNIADMMSDVRTWISNGSTDRAIESLAYQGFDVYVIIRAVRGQLSNLDIITAITMFFMRGANFTKLSDKSSPEAKTFVAQLTAAGFKSNSNKKRDTLTLPRLAASFPIISVMILASRNASSSFRRLTSDFMMGSMHILFHNPSYLAAVTPRSIMRAGHGIFFDVLLYCSMVQNHQLSNFDDTKLDLDRNKPYLLAAYKSTATSDEERTAFWGNNKAFFDRLIDQIDSFAPFILGTIELQHRNQLIVKGTLECITGSSHESLRLDVQELKAELGRLTYKESNSYKMLFRESDA